MAYIKRDKNRKIDGECNLGIPKIFDEKKNTWVKNKSFEKIDEKSKEYQDYKNKTGKYEVEQKPNYDTETMWDILEKEIPALKKYRKSVREDN